MARPYNPEVNDHVIFYDSNCKPRPGTVIAVTDVNTVDVRIVRSGEVHLAVTRQVVGKAVSTWKIY